MKRHDRLQPFSREHHQALSLGLALKQQRPDAQALLVSQKASLLQHFEAEERLFATLFSHWPHQTLSDRFQYEHQQLRAALTQPQHHDQTHVGQLLIDHVRFEERVLFIAIEAYWQAHPNPAESPV